MPPGETPIVSCALEVLGGGERCDLRGGKRPVIEPHLIDRTCERAVARDPVADEEGIGRCPQCSGEDVLLLIRDLAPIQIEMELAVTRVIICHCHMRPP